MLAVLYTLRVFAGAAATVIRFHPGCSPSRMFLFFCLAVVKRQTRADAHSARAARRRDLPDAATCRTT